MLTCYFICVILRKHKCDEYHAKSNNVGVAADKIKVRKSLVSRFKQHVVSCHLLGLENMAESRHTE